MPQPKQLKKMVRERMAKTGESYTTARRKLMNAPKAQQAGTGFVEEAELPEYPAPAGVVQYDAGLWHRVLTQAGVTHPVTGQPLSQALLAGLAGGIGFMVFTFEYAETTTVTVVTRAHPEPYTANLLARCGVPVTQRTTNSAKQAQEHLDAGLDAGRAVVVRVTHAALPWVDGEAVEESDSLDIAVVGEHGDDYLVDDGSGALQLISPEQLAAARRAGRKDKHFSAWAPQALSPRVKVLRLNVLEAVGQTTGRLLGTRELEGIPAHFAKNFGVAGMRTWADRLRDTTTKKGWTAMFADEARLRDGMAQLAGFLTSNRFSGSGGLRGLYADFLAEASALPGLAPLAEPAGAYRALAPRWDALAAAVDPAVAVGERAAHFARLADLVEELADAEEAAARGLAVALAAATG
ncbi:hypothetical protein NCCP1664_02450 [Zafaria cholistanensis]|uniref:DUF4872 domain-containing protein n=1 Tax=Zafaria cholistanensis TaxID=1682741 RepID=A0A5A7NPN6_9MICC|nr:BtrH N-terminal domain-containing protein [Zafaria cholistanensis]GER21748.1 hypothetical protein NCCP1664_02450 [Zafaria cholistanensis]